MNKEDISNINYHIHHNLQPFRRADISRKIKLDISEKFYFILKNKYGITGRFKDATYLLDKIKSTKFRSIESNKLCSIKKPEVRISKPKLNAFKSKPSITIRFFVKNIFLS